MSRLKSKIPDISKKITENVTNKNSEAFVEAMNLLDQIQQSKKQNIV